MTSSVKRPLLDPSRQSWESTSPLIKSQISENVGNLERDEGRGSFLDHLQRVAVENGYRKRQVTLIWRDLRVEGNRAMTEEGISTFGTAFLAFLKLPLAPIFFLLSRLQKPSGANASTTLLHQTSGFVRPGEMLLGELFRRVNVDSLDYYQGDCLVLGKPDSGARPLARVLGKTSERVEKLYSKVDGEVTINGLSSSEFKKRYQNEVIYSGDSDVHLAALTVRQIISAALSFKIGLTTSYNGVNAVRSEFLTYLENLLGLRVAMDTVVGNQLVRGVSGVAEQMSASAMLNIWDQTTKGLDATHALQIMKGIRLASTTLSQTTIVHISQTSDSIFQLFDRVLLLAQGRTIYIGPASRAQAYFQELGLRMLPRQSVPDFLNSVTELKERVLAEGVNPATVPSSPVEFEKAWLASQDYRSMLRELDSVQNTMDSEDVLETFQVAETAYRREYFSSNVTSVFSRTSWEQFTTSLAREFNLMRGQRALVIGQLVFLVIIGVCMGTMNLKMPLTALGAFSRGGIIYFSLLINAAQTQAEMPRLVTERSYIYKHKEWTFYHAGLRY
ncbi:hypothetical protein HDU93_008082, partial [Gonapodya sp. JEL0774]